MTITDSRREALARPLARRRAALPIAAASVVAAGAAYVAARNPYHAVTFPPCTFHAATGWYCPGCGGTRALYSLMHGDIATALHMNAFTTLFFLPPVAIGIGWWLAASVGLTSRRFAFKPWMAWTYAAGAGVFWIVRNLPGFEFLRP